ncbi:arginine--tRNA ligase [Clostridium saccharoperbutylacetonicum]|uniref:arginine--tRNA ligase domain-containing protein n=1 Tax=Clostridium saccharoperbutylacetonicum TaxID=36745 RepID=UPI000983D0DD|nr:arginine--tRNA ligase [Clostridium saccharoperbutylacetonicum]AQR93803.1 arginine--tRNA ligase [Clostridium saccharoperbutylacetonicum]NSB29503.1 arginyl-tRNA synthetase [Clostridium saccharoperbutylacetonicum]
MDYKSEIVELIKSYVDLNFDNIKSLIEVPPKPEMGDYAFPCFQLSKVMKKAPNIIAEDLKNNMVTEVFEKIENLGPYLNFFVDKAVFAENIIEKILEEGDEYGKSNNGNEKTICIEYSSPHIKNPFQISSFCTKVIGNALTRMYKKQGYNVIEIANSEALGTEFDKSLVTEFLVEEAVFNNNINQVINELSENGILVESNGVKVVNLKKYNMPPCIILKDDGTFTYALRDIVAVIYRKKYYNFDIYIYVVDSTQESYYKQIFKVLELAGYEWAKDCICIGLGLIKFSDRNLFMRDWTTVLMKDMFKVEALVFACLKNLKENNVILDWNEILGFDGENGPYVQAAYASWSSILTKGVKCTGKADYKKLSSSEEFELVKRISNFNEIITLAIEKLEPSILTKYIIEVAKRLEKFYGSYFMINLEDEPLKAARLNLVRAALQVIKNGLELLGIGTLEKIL